VNNAEITGMMNRGCILRGIAEKMVESGELSRQENAEWRAQQEYEAELAEQEHEERHEGQIMAVIGETPNERQEQERTRDEVLARSYKAGQYIDQFTAVPPLTRSILNRLPRGLMGLPPRSLPKSDELSYKLDEATKELVKECNDIQIVTRRKA